jgi:nicotinamidase-related amidase
MNPQFDYLPGGALETPGCLRIVQNLAQLASRADLVILTRYCHPENHFSFADDPLYQDGSWPPYCVQGTKGARIFRPLAKLADYTLSLGMNRNPPEQYSAFTGKTLRPVEDIGDILERQPVDEIIVGGFLFETNVKWTLFDANAVGLWKVSMPLDSVGTLEETININPLQRAGIRVTETWDQIY